MKKRSMLKRSGLIMSAVISMAAPAGKASQRQSKQPKPCKKSKSPHTLMVDDPGLDIEPLPGGAPVMEVLLRPPGNLLPQLPDEPPSAQQERYPWKPSICTTVFWIGEKPSGGNPVPNHASSWDENWMRSYGGFDSPNPDERKGFLPARFKPRQNPFYVALPYNDMTSNGHKAEARKIIPWYKNEFESLHKSVCKGRWIAIRKGDRVCYAQWEDAGPFCTDDADYVFGNARPNANANNDAGLDVSPAVRDYLGLDGTDVTDWRFVDLDEVPQGPWADHGDNNDFVMNRGKTRQKAVAMVKEHTSRSNAVQ